MHGFQENEVVLPTEYDVIVGPPTSDASRDFSWRILKERPWLPDIVFHFNFSSGMHGFWDDEVLLQAGYDVIVIYPLGGASGDFSWRIQKEQPWLPDSVP